MRELHDEAVDEAFVQTVLAASNDCIKILNLDGDLTFMSEGGQRTMEVSDFNRLRGCPWPAFWEGESHADAKTAVAEAREGRNYRFQGPANTAAGNPRWWDVQVTPIPGPDGRPARLLSVSRDITQLKAAEEQQRLLALELNHRMKNLLTVVQAIASQTFRAGGAPDQLESVLMDRLSALSTAQDLLIRTERTGAALSDVVSATIRAHGREAQISMSGPDVRLSSRCTLAMSLALHELATNAVKYGALSTGEGRVTVAWSLDSATFSLAWTEQGGPVVSPPEHTGFGSILIKRALRDSVGGTSELGFEPEGAVFRMSTTVEALEAEAV